MSCITAFDQPITIQQLFGSADAHGFIDETDDNNWSTYATAYARVQTTGGREFWKVDRVDADVSAEWRCQWDTTLAAATPAMRLKHGSTIHQIVSVIDVDLAHNEISIQTKRAV